MPLGGRGLTKNREGHKKKLGKAQALPRRGTTDALLSFGESAKAKAVRREVTRVRLIFAQGKDLGENERHTLCDKKIEHNHNFLQSRSAKRKDVFSCNHIICSET